MLAEMTMEQLTEWQEYDKLEPFGEERADLRSAIVASSVVNAIIRVNSTSRNPRLTKVEDFMPKFDGKGKGGQRKPITSKDEWKSVIAMARNSVATKA